jgi:hypothetical protein
MLWVKMSAASQSKGREDPEFKTAKENLDCILLWEIIRKSHLTHTFGIGDPMREINVSEQESRYANLKQGDRELWNGQGYHLLAMPLRCIRCCRLPHKDRKKKCWTLL